jgi:hypothetical protein
VRSCTCHLGGKITKSHAAVPGTAVGQVNTVKMEGSYDNGMVGLINNS